MLGTFNHKYKKTIYIYIPLCEKLHFFRKQNLIKASREKGNILSHKC